jgi:hypothetical protein
MAAPDVNTSDDVATRTLLSMNIEQDKMTKQFLKIELKA